ncbi:SA1788 family PVL leukocidin-associated protein [Mammaliicoccus sciuri]|uniref:SA1788 family PVL leukocidin-associated protein n=1 Tax=Mammaliicoccus sciuri TaxID=1296 RepID=UPI0038526B3F
MSKKIVVEGQKYTLTDSHLNSIEKHQLNMPFVRMRIRAGWKIDTAVNVPKGVAKCDAESYLKNKSLESKEKKPKKDYSKPKPWLRKYPQKTEFGDYAKQLFNDCCGSW